LTRASDKSYRSAEGLVVKSWDEEFAVAYAPSQAKTHLINAAAATVLQLAAQHHVTAESLLQLYGSEPSTGPVEADVTAANQVHLNTTLDGLINAGLLQSTP
jgi:ribosomal protein S19E (S16A)